jgi:hypothetical protein
LVSIFASTLLLFILIILWLAELNLYPRARFVNCGVLVAAGRYRLNHNGKQQVGR